MPLQTQSIKPMLKAYIQKTEIFTKILLHKWNIIQYFIHQGVEQFYPQQQQATQMSKTFHCQDKRVDFDPFNIV